jgi:hypothetical protein
MVPLVHSLKKIMLATPNFITLCVSKFPINHGKNYVINNFSLGKASERPTTKEFYELRNKLAEELNLKIVNQKPVKGQKEKVLHSECFNQLNNTNLRDLFIYLENNKLPTVYIYWVQSDNDETFLKIKSSYKNHIKQNKGNTAVFNSNVLFTKEKPVLYIGKSESQADGRAISHLDYTNYDYKALKLNECCKETEVVLTMIQFTDIDKKDTFWSKVLPFNLEHFLAKELNPLLGSHK